MGKTVQDRRRYFSIFGFYQLTNDWNGSLQYSPQLVIRCALLVVASALGDGLLSFNTSPPLLPNSKPTYPLPKDGKQTAVGNAGCETSKLSLCHDDRGIFPPSVSSAGEARSTCPSPTTRHVLQNGRSSSKEFWLHNISHMSTLSFAQSIR